MPALTTRDPTPVFRSLYQAASLGVSATIFIRRDMTADRHSGQHATTLAS